jgi:hypothetical protein
MTSVATFHTIEGVVEVEHLLGPEADPDAPPRLLVEVPHGADRRAHYDALRSRLVGDLPADLHIFFHVNTDVGAYDYGRRVAERVIEAHPSASALLLRCLVPRTFIDTNRLESTPDGLSSGGLTAGLAPYVRHPDDVALLLSLHRSYVALVERAYELVCQSGGFALNPHTYGPRTMGIARIDDTIVDALRAAHEPDAWASWPERPEVDLITRTAEGVRYAPEGMPDALIEAYTAMGLRAVEGGTYALHPATQGYRWSTRYPESVLCLELRRDLLVERYTPFEEMIADPSRVEPLVAPLVAAIAPRL